MTDGIQSSARTLEVQDKVGRLLSRRLALAQSHWVERSCKSLRQTFAGMPSAPPPPGEVWSEGGAYLADLAQRSVLFWDTLRQRGNVWIEHERSGKPPMLHFRWEMVLDARSFDRPVNYALVRIVPPEGVTIDPLRRPYLIIDPRAGHGPGIGGFKDDSQVGVALREGHPVYFVIFFPDPVPGQNLTDVTAAERAFVHRLRELHPDSPKPVVIGNCQGGWAAMMLAASEPDETGPVVINGAPMSYWGGAWRAGEGDNPMRYAAGLLGGTWPASFASDLGNGVFDGAWLVQNFENLNPANTWWDKYYHLFANVDTEPGRFLEFERWWGGFYLLNREEIEWITRNLFVGNRLWSGSVQGRDGHMFDLRGIRSPIILFASLGDNITPPQQAFNWVADVYGSTDEIKARGQVIVGLLHEDVGHLGIFVSGRVAKKEHAQIVSVLKSIEALPPGLYGMQILERPRPDGTPEYDVQFVEHRLEEVAARLNRFQRADEKPFEAVERVSEFNQRAYELLARPWVQAASHDLAARLSRSLHPLRVQRWALSDLNPWLAWLGPAASAVRKGRRAVPPEAPLRRLERCWSDSISAGLDWVRELRDAAGEAVFYLTYGPLFGALSAGGTLERHETSAPPVDPRDLPFVQEALASLSEGGYPEAIARVMALLADHGRPVPLERIRSKQELASKYSDLIPETGPEQQRRLRGEQEIIVRYEPERALETLPLLVRDPADRERLQTLLDVVFSPGNLENFHPTPEQVTMLGRIRERVGRPAAGNPPVESPASRCRPRRRPLGERSHGTPHQRPLR